MDERTFRRLTRLRRSPIPIQALEPIQTQQVATDWSHQIGLRGFKKEATIPISGETHNTSQTIVFVGVPLVLPLQIKGSGTPVRTTSLLRRPGNTQIGWRTLPKIEQDAP